jgi:uncharacterized protein YoxC
MTEQQAHYLLIDMGLIAGAMVIAAIAVIAVGIAVILLMKQLKETAAETTSKVYPLLERVERIAAKTEHITATAEAILADVQPKIERVTTNIAQTSDVYRAKVAEIDALIADTTGKARRQSDRVDSMITSTLSRTAAIAAHLQNAIMVPARQLSGVVSGARTTVEALVHQFAPKPTPKTPKAVAFEGESVYTGETDDYHA